MLLQKLQDINRIEKSVLLPYHDRNHLFTEVKYAHTSPEIICLQK